MTFILSTALVENSKTAFCQLDLAAVSVTGATPPLLTGCPSMPRLSDNQFGLVIAMIGGPMAAAGAFYGFMWLMVLGIVLPPIAFGIRSKW